MLTAEEAFQFDLQGYLVLRGVLDREQVLEVGAEVARLDDAGPDRLPASIPIWTPVINEYRILNILDPVPSALAFIDHEVVHARVAGLMDAPFRLVEAYSITRGPGIGLYLHHITEPHSSYRVVDGVPRCTYVKVNVPLTDCGPNDGPFCVIEGSHKSQVPYPYSMFDADWDPPTKDLDVVESMARLEQGKSLRDIRTIPGFKELHTEAGDVVVFSESLKHGARKNRGARRRRGIYLGYGPSSCANWHGVSYSDELLERASPEQRRLLEGPHIGFRYEYAPAARALPDEEAYPYYPNSERARLE